MFKANSTNVHVFLRQLLNLVLVSALLMSPLIAEPSRASTDSITSSSKIYFDDVGATLTLKTGSGFKANEDLLLGHLNIVVVGTGLTAVSVSVNLLATEATIVFTGTALHGKVSITATRAAYFQDPGSDSNTLDFVILPKVLPACHASAPISEPCLQSGNLGRTGSSGFQLSYRNNSEFGGGSFSLQAEIDMGSGFVGVENGDEASAVVILYPTSTDVGGRLKTATWAMASHKDFGYTKTIETVNGTEVVKLTTSFEYINFTTKTTCGILDNPTFGHVPEAACESVSEAGDYVTSADYSVDFFAETDLSWINAETGADGGYLNYRGSSFMWGSTAATPLRFQMVGPKHKSSDDTDLNSGSFEVYLPQDLVTYLYGAGFNPNTNLTLTRHDEGVLTETLSGTGNVTLTRPNGGDLLIRVPNHPFSAPVFTVSSTPSTPAASVPAPMPVYSGPLLEARQSVVAGQVVSFTGRRLQDVSSAHAGTTKLKIVSATSDRLVLEVPASTPSGVYDLVLNSSHGVLTFQQGLTVTKPPFESLEATVEQKLNVGSFKGFIAIYTKGYEGQRLSAKVAGKWLVVPEISENWSGNKYSRTVRFTGAGESIKVHLYIDREFVRTEDLITQ